MGGWEEGRRTISMNMPLPEEIPPAQGGPIPWDLQTTLYDDWPSTVSENDMIGGGGECREEMSTKQVL